MVANQTDEFLLQCRSVALEEKKVFEDTSRGRAEFETYTSVWLIPDESISDKTAKRMKALKTEEDRRYDREVGKRAAASYATWPNSLYGPCLYAMTDGAKQVGINLSSLWPEKPAENAPTQAEINE